MFVKYGFFQHPINLVGITTNSDVQTNERNVGVAINHVVNIEGQLRNTSTNPKDLDSIIRSMEQAYSSPGYDFGLFHDDGTETVHTWYSHNTIGGIRPMLLSYPKYQGAEYVTFRSFQVRLEFKTPMFVTSFLSFTETLSIEGGGATFDVKPVNFGPGVRQKTRTHNPCRATQSGSATARFVHPEPPKPIWEFALAESVPKITRETRPVGSQRYGNLVLEECVTNWQYDYVWPTRLDGEPHYARL